jgi:IS5 family transposase
MKTDFRMEQNYLHVIKSMQITALMSATAWNLKKMIEMLKEKVFQIIFRLFFSQKFYYHAA